MAAQAHRQNGRSRTGDSLAEVGPFGSRPVKPGQTHVALVDGNVDEVVTGCGGCGQALLPGPSGRQRLFIETYRRYGTRFHDLPVSWATK